MFLTRSEYGMVAEKDSDDVFLYRGIDRGVNTFSPEGRLFQGTSSEYPSESKRSKTLPVEYANEAIKVLSEPVSRILFFELCASLALQRSVCALRKV